MSLFFFFKKTMTVIQVAQMIAHRDQNKNTKTQEIERVKTSLRYY